MKTLKSNWQLVDNFGAVKHSIRRKWDTQKRIPSLVKLSLNSERQRVRVHEMVEAARDKMNGKSGRVMLARKLKEGFRLVGQDKIVSNFEEAKEFARSKGYNAVRFLNNVVVV